MKDDSPYATAVIEDDLLKEEFGEVFFDEKFEKLDDLDLAALTVDDLAALKDTVFRSALIGIATQPEISLQTSHQNGSHSAHSDHVTHSVHSSSGDLPLEN